MQKEDIDIFLSENKQIEQRIANISKKYNMTDFVKITKEIRDYLQHKKPINIKIISGCLYNKREEYFKFYADSVERRLTTEYLEFLLSLLETSEKIDKVFYIVAYHYLTLAKQLGYDLTFKDSSPFSFMGDEMSLQAKSNYNILRLLSNDKLLTKVKDIEYFTEDDLAYYNKIYRECGYSHHATKHFSLINYLDDFSCVLNTSYFDYEFEKALNLFIFKYQTLYMPQDIHYYLLCPKEKDKMIHELVDVI